MTTANGFDIAHYQDQPTPIDWSLIRTNTPLPTWVSLKATEGDSYTDSWFARNRAGAHSCGIEQVLLYHWLSPYKDVAAQAAWFLANVGALAPGEGVMLDIEENGDTAERARQWCEIVEAATGRPVALYTGVFFAAGSIWNDLSLFNGARPRILAAYTTPERAAHYAVPFGWDAWQFTSTGTLSGIGNPVDLDQVDDLAIFDVCCGVAPAPSMPPAPNPPAPFEWPPLDFAGGTAYGLFPIAAKRSTRPGDTGDLVRYLQSVILHKCGGNITIDGKFGPQTTSRVKDLQRFMHLNVDGWVGRQTWGAIDMLALA